MKKLFFLLIILLFKLGYAQREANIWHFGAGVGLDFNSCEPVPVFSEMRSTEGCASIANGQGELQFYTEGGTVWNRNHQIMNNGTGLLGHRSATQSAMIVQRPGSLNEYYVFTIDEIGKSNGLMYSVIDMNGDSGLGEVTTKNTALVAPVVEKIHAVQHANGEDVWVSVHGFENNTFYSFLVTAAGVEAVPVTSAVGPVISGDLLATIGAMKFSHNGKKLASANYEDGVSLFDFDANTGLFSNPVVVTPSLYSYGIEFSKSNNLLYVSTSYLDIDNRLLQYNLNAPNINASEVVLLDLSDTGSVGSLQMGPDHKLYVSIENRDYLGVINEPDRLGISCNFVEFGLELNSGLTKRGLPLFLSPIFHDEMLVEDTCFGDITNFRLSTNVETISWDFGDPDSGIDNISTEIEPLHIFSAPGTYTITTNIPANCGPTPTITKEITITGIQAPTAVQLVQCDDNADGFSSFNLNEADRQLTQNEDLLLYYRTRDEAISRVNQITPADSYQNIVANSDSVWVSVENNTGCFQVVEVELIVSPNDVFSTIPPITFELCDDAFDDGITNFDLSSAVDTIRQLFPDQATDITFFRNLEDALAEADAITQLDSYENIGYPFTQDIYIRVDDRLTNNCLGIGNVIQLTVIAQPQFEVVTEVDFCLGDTSEVILEVYNAGDVYSYEWTDASGEIISTASDAKINQGGLYTLVATSINGCTSFPIVVDVIEYQKIGITSGMITITDGLENNTISIDESQLGTGNYEYTLDDEFGVYQDTPFFQNVSTGAHTIYVREENSCNPSVIEISVIGFPKFFTPNNDTFYDTWNLEGLSNDLTPNSKVLIFDRYGNFITQLTPGSIGWDGTINGQQAVQSDYWFKAELFDQEGKVRTVSGHFSLKR